MTQSGSISRSTEMGQAVELLFETNRRRFTIASAYLWLWPAIRLRQIVFLLGPDDRPLGFATWAHLSDEVSREFADRDPSHLPVGDWNEGANLWIMDFVAPWGHARPLANALNTALGGRFDQARRLVRRRDGSVRGVRRLVLSSRLKQALLDD